MPIVANVPQAVAVPSSSPRRLIWSAAGWVCVVLAGIGAVLPGMPTTVFLIGASFCFSKSSPRFHAWLLANRWFGPRLAVWAATGGMPRSAKRAALGAMWTAVAISSVILLAVHPVASVATVALGVAGTACILLKVKTVPER